MTLLMINCLDNNWPKAGMVARAPRDWLEVRDLTKYSHREMKCHIRERGDNTGMLLEAAQ